MQKKQTKKSSSTFQIVPKDKRVLKSSKVRAYFKEINDLLEPRKQEIFDKANQATIDCMIYGYSEIRIPE